MITSVPGPASRALIDDLARFECPAITARRARRAGETGVPQDPIVWRRGSGVYIEDVDGNVFLDFTAAFAVSGFGHAHPELVGAIVDQAHVLIHGMGDVFPTDVKIAFARRLAELTPGALRQSIFTQSGAEAVEVALKTAVLATGRQRVMAFHGSYHGLSLGALGVTAYRDAFRAPFGARVDQHVTHVPYPTCLRCPFKTTYPGCGLACLDFIETTLSHPAAGADDLGAIIVEPLQGRGGIIDPPDEWLPGLASLCKKYDLLLIVDEIFTGFGRTGKRFAVQHTGVEPDLMCLGKGMTGGFPLSATIGTEGVMAAWGASRGESIHTSTFLGHPIGCAMGLRAADIMERDRLDEVAHARGEVLERGLLELAERYPERIAEVRGRGLMVGMELVSDRASDAPDGPLCLRITHRMLEKGVLLLPSGHHGQVLAFTPPFVVSHDEVGTMLELLGEAFAEELGAP